MGYGIPIIGIMELQKVFRCAETFIVSDVGDTYTWQQKEMIYETPNVL